MWKKVTLCFALAASGFAGAQPIRNRTSNDAILVVGHDLDRQVRQFVSALTQNTEQGQLLRFEDPVCPRAIGLDPSQNAAVERRIRRVTAAVGMPVGGAKCVANLILLIATEKKNAINALWERSPKAFGGRSAHAVRGLADAPGPVALWKNTGLIDAQGAHLGRSSNSDFYQTKTVGTPSRLNPVTRPYVVGSTMVVEAQAIRGVTATQVADFAVMAAFSQADLPASSRLPSPTILTLIEDAEAGRAVPLSLTYWDLGFLKSLKAASGATTAHLQRPLIERFLKKELEDAIQATE